MKLFKILIISLLLFSCVSFDARATTYASYDRGTSYPLHGACYRNNLPAIKILVESGEHDINGYDTITTSTFSETPLHLAARWSGPDTMRYLLDNGADPNKPTIGRVAASPLHIMVMWNPQMVPEVVEKYNGDLYFSDQNGNKGFHYAAMYGRVDLCKYMLNNMDTIPVNKNGETPLHSALELDAYLWSQGPLDHYKTIMFLSDHMDIDPKALSIAYANIFIPDSYFVLRIVSVWIFFVLMVKTYPVASLLLFAISSILFFLIVRKLVRKILKAKEE